MEFRFKPWRSFTWKSWLRPCIMDIFLFMSRVIYIWLLVKSFYCYIWSVRQAYRLTQVNYRQTTVQSQRRVCCCWVANAKKKGTRRWVINSINLARWFQKWLSRRRQLHSGRSRKNKKKTNDFPQKKRVIDWCVESTHIYAITYTCISHAKYTYMSVAKQTSNLL